MRTCPKWRNPGKKNVEHDPDTPNICFWSVISFQNLRSNVIRASNNVFELLSCQRMQGEAEEVTFFVKDREAEIGGLERRILVLIQEQEILWLKIPMNNPHGMAGVHNLHNSPHQGGGGALGVMALGDDPVKELTSSAELHDQMHGMLVLIRPLQIDNIGLPRQMVHDLHLPPHILDVFLVGQLPLCDCLAREQLPCLLVRAEMRNAELPPPQLLPHRVVVLDVLHRPPENGAHLDRLRGRLGGGSGRRGHCRGGGGGSGFGRGGRLLVGVVGGGGSVAGGWGVRWRGIVALGAAVTHLWNEFDVR